MNCSLLKCDVESTLMLIYLYSFVKYIMFKFNIFYYKYLKILYNKYLRQRNFININREL